MASLHSYTHAQIKYKLLFIVVAIFNTTICSAQNFSERAKLDTVPQNGYYNIAVTPQLSSYIRTDFSDLRIADSKEQYQPYITNSINRFFYSNNYTALNIREYALTDSGSSVLAIENPQANPINNITLKIRNAAVSRNATISGSDDNKKWFTIKEDIFFEKEFADDKDQSIQTLSFPPSSYHYYKLVIDNSKNDPLNIIEAGYSRSLEYKNVNNYIANPAVSFIQNDSSDHYSYLFVEQAQPYHVSKITLAVSGPPFFKRTIDLIKQNGTSAAFEISSDTIFHLYMPVFNDKKFLLRIYNGDNPPLHIKNLVTEQESKNIIAFLEAGKEYHLLMNDSTATQPNYDLQQFKDSIIRSTQALRIISFESNISGNAGETTPWTKRLLWPIIVLVIVVLSLLTFRLTKEVEKKNQL